MASLERGERPLMAKTGGCGPLDELVALHYELGIFQALDLVSTDRRRAGLPDELLFRTSAALPFVRPSPSAGTDVLERTAH